LDPKISRRQEIRHEALASCKLFCVVIPNFVLGIVHDTNMVIDSPR